MNLADAQPQRRAPKPWQSRTEYLVDDALMRATAGTDDEIRNMRPVAGVQNVFPERLGFMKEEWTVSEVLNIDRQTPNYRSWVSGMPAQKSMLADDGTQAGSRYSMGSMWSA